MIFSKDTSWIKPSRLREGEKVLVLVTYDKSIFNANNRKWKVWKKKRKSPLWLKKKLKKRNYSI